MLNVNIEVKLKDEEYFNNWNLDPAGTTYSYGSWSIPRHAVLYHNRRVAQGLVKTEDEHLISVVVGPLDTVPINALNEDSQNAIAERYPEMFI